MQTDVRIRLLQWVIHKQTMFIVTLEWHPLHLTTLSGDFFNLNYVNVGEAHWTEAQKT